MSVFEYDDDIHKREGIRYLCGVDEAGRGCLAGPVFAAALVLPRGFELDGLDDSKKLNKNQRERFYDIIIDGAIGYSVALVDVDEIERINILNSALLSMRNAVKALSLTPDLVLVDGNKLPDMALPSRAVVGGDCKSASIAAASVVAKVERDRYMVWLAGQYPGYGFERHKGYGTAFHYSMLTKLGPCPAHRPSFLKKWLANDRAERG